MIVLTRQDGASSRVGINSRRVLYVDKTQAYGKGSRITMNNGDVIEVRDLQHKVIARVDKDRRKG